MITVRQPRYFIWLRYISIIVIFAFLTTQLDLPLAFGYSVYQPRPAGDSKTDLNELRNKLDKELFGNICYSADTTAQDQTTQTSPTQPEISAQKSLETPSQPPAKE